MLQCINPKALRLWRSMQFCVSVLFLIIKKETLYLLDISLFQMYWLQRKTYSLNVPLMCPADFTSLKWAPRNVNTKHLSGGTVWQQSATPPTKHPCISLEWLLGPPFQVVYFLWQQLFCYSHIQNYSSTNWIIHHIQKWRHSLNIICNGEQ